MDQLAKRRWVFRMIHYQNLELILRRGIVSRYRENNPDYIHIGAPDLISLRDEYKVGIDPPGGTLGEFIPFYFAGHSPMLYKIKTGNGCLVVRTEERKEEVGILLKSLNLDIPVLVDNENKLYYE